MIYNPKPKDGRTRSRRSFVFYDDTIKKLKEIANASNVQVSELVDGALSQIIDAWEQENGTISTEQNIRLTEAVERANASEPLKRGNPNKWAKNKSVKQ